MKTSLNTWDFASPCSPPPGEESGLFLGSKAMPCANCGEIPGGLVDFVGQNACQGQRRPLFSFALLMQKTKKSVAKRFKISGTGKLIRRTPGFRHLLAAKSTKSKRRASRDKLVAPGHAAPLLRCLPTGLR
jgi:large subunit ribosomal protein L35